MDSQSRQPYLVDVMSTKQKVRYLFLISAWVVVVTSFWYWWLLPEHIITMHGILITSLLMVWTTLLPTWYFYFTFRMKRPNTDLPIPQGQVAMVVTKAASEPWSVVRKTLEAMIAQNFPAPNDVWLADESPNRETLLWCLEHKVKVSCRKDHPDYQNQTFPGRVKCKEGNLRYFYERYGYALYDYVVQMDADHVPEPDYLLNMIRPFNDPQVGYVAAPSICDSNLRESWVVRARLYVEAALHGALQAGYHSGWAPMPIGSHYAVRTKALRELHHKGLGRQIVVGGLGPELAEDHTTGLAMNAAGWRGAFALDAIAHGDGASSFADSITQEFQWSRSLMIVLLIWTPGYFPRLTWKLRLQYVFAQLWYPFFGLHLLAALLMPLIALVTKQPWENIPYLEFFIHLTPVTIFCILPIKWLQRQGWFRPSTALAVSWETMIFQLVRWPWVLWGCSQAMVIIALRREFNFRVTPKGVTDAKPLPLKTLFPYLLVAAVSALTAIVVSDPGSARGYYWFAIVNSVLYLAVTGLVIVLHIHENKASLKMPAYKFVGMQTAAVLIIGFLALWTISLRVESALAVILPQTGQKPMVVIPQSKPAIRQIPDELVLGVFDQDGAFNGANNILIEEFFTPWRKDDTNELRNGVDKILAKERIPLVGLEPWPFNTNGLSRDSLLADISSGQYDQTITRSCSTLGQYAPQPILIRLGHEMELEGTKPWAQGKPQEFVAAYQRFVTLCTAEGNNLGFVWSPAGAPNLVDYYPGDQFVDFVGLTSLEVEAWSLQHGGPRGLTFEELFQPRYELVKGYNKPIIIAEFGVARTSSDQKKWLLDAFGKFPNYPLLKAVIYFNAIEPGYWDTIKPDWRINPSFFPPS